MIVTVTLNPALDLTYDVAALVPHGTHRVASVRERAGGKGLNVARVLHRLGEPVLATGLLGGPTGTRIAALLAGEGVPSSFVEVTGETRRTVAVVDPGDATGFWEPGPTITAPEWAAFLTHFRSLLPRADVVTLSGSLPPGLPLDAYASLIALARRADVPTVLDTSGPALRSGLRARPTVIKPNAAELAALRTQLAEGADDDLRPDEGDLRPDEGDEGVVAFARGLEAEAVVLSRGARGLLAVHGSHVWAAAPPERIDGNPTGAGDACVAALARGLRDRTGWPELLTDAVALSAAAVAVPIAGAFDAELYRRLRLLVHSADQAADQATDQAAERAGDRFVAGSESGARSEGPGPATSSSIRGEMSCS